MIAYLMEDVFDVFAHKQHFQQYHELMLHKMRLLKNVSENMTIRIYTNIQSLFSTWVTAGKNVVTDFSILKTFHHLDSLGLLIYYIRHTYENKPVKRNCKKRTFLFVMV